jgi:hypothetical protein
LAGEAGALIAAGCLLLLAACGGTRTADKEENEVAASDGLVGLEGAISDASVADVSSVEPAARTSGDEGVPAVDPLAADYPEAPIPATPPADPTEDQPKEGEKE